jgi:hypothetical protein
VREYCDNNQGVKAIETSALTGHNCSEAFMQLVSEMMSRDSSIKQSLHIEQEK